MQKQTLSGQWEFRQVGKEEWLSAQVPGGAHTDLLAHNLIPDPFFGDNELAVQWVAEAEWDYRRTFTPTPKMLAEEKVFLVCDGLDTLSEVILNGVTLGRTDNMFRQYRWEIKPLLKAGANDLHIQFASTIKYCTNRNQVKPLTGVGDVTIPGGPHLRKAPCHFGWDWGPKLPPVGIWKDLRLEGYTAAKLSAVHIRQNHGCCGAELSVKVSLEDVSAASWNQGAKIHLILTSPDGSKTWQDEALANTLEPINLGVTVEKPQLWYPNGYGAQPLYQLDIVLKDGKQILDQRHYQVGLRQVELRQKPDEWGKSFTFAVNGVPVFAKGANWIPTDSFPTRITREVLKGLLTSAIAANMNMLRVWGGGVYESEDFYDLCDELGILVWQDAAFACNIYPLDEPDFVENIHQEIIQNIQRIRHRACLAMWCGNNEMEQGWEIWGWNKPENQVYKAAYDQFFHHTLKSWVNELDADHYYLPSSPTSETPFTNANGQKQGDAHYWDVWHGRKPFTAYRGQFPRFMSEFGFQSLPPLPTVRTYAEEKDWNMTSYIMEHHQRSGSGNGLMIGQMTDTFRMPKDFPALVYLSMLLQAEGIRYGVEHYRRSRSRVSGTLIWQLNDCWPVASWSSLDYYGRWKALHYAAKRFYAPVLLSILDDGTRMEVHLTTDRTDLWHGEVKWFLATAAGKQLNSGAMPVILQPLSSKQVCAMNFDLTPEERRESVFIAELWQNGCLISRSLATFAPNKHLSLTDPKLKAEMKVVDNKLEITISAKTLARFVELNFADLDVVFSDNYIDIPAGWKTTVTCLIPAGWTLENLKKAFKMQSLFNSYA